AAARNSSFVEQLTAIFVPLYRLHAPNPKLGRALITELTFTTNATMQGRFAAFDRPAFIGRIAEVVERGKASGQIGTAADSQFVGRVVCAIFAWALRAWLAGPNPTAAGGVAELRRELDLLVKGLLPAKPAEPIRRRTAR